MLVKMIRESYICGLIILLVLGVQICLARYSGFQILAVAFGSMNIDQWPARSLSRY